MVPGHIELAGYDKIRYINTMYPWEGKEYHRGAYSMEATGAEKRNVFRSRVQSGRFLYQIL